MKYKIIILCISLLLVSGCFINSNWDEPVLTRETIQGYDIVIKYINEGKYEEANILADAIETTIWYLRNSKDTEFYDSLQYWSIRPNTLWSPNETKERIIVIQDKLCPKSDLSRAHIEKSYPDSEYKEEYINKRARC